MGKGSGYGKVILFGEHFVVHGIPGIVSAIDLTVDAEVKKDVGNGFDVKDERKGASGYAEKKKLQQKESIERILKMFGIDQEKNHLDIWLGGGIAFSGIGSSAASSVAIARAIAEEFDMRLSDKRINEIAYEAEKAYAGTPSGIDNTAATFGGLIWFKKNLSGEKDSIQNLNVSEPVEIVICDTGIVADTKEMVAGVAERKKKYPEKYGKIFKQEEELVVKARKALEGFDLKKVGQLMDMNHKLLQDIEVSCKELDHLVKIARENGAYGAKMTGGGGGGCIVALTPGKKLQEQVAKAIEKEGFKVLRTKVGVKRSI
ncbi:MAG: mevalonate kinase [Candidatus Aenigmarchaeota archaeon]|nr:mevalonate kinase [Candidatus Aenigmarchaeota archaeon]